MIVKLLTNTNFFTTKTKINIKPLKHVVLLRNTITKEKNKFCILLSLSNASNIYVFMLGEFFLSSLGEIYTFLLFHKQYF